MSIVYFAILCAHGHSWQRFELGFSGGPWKGQQTPSNPCSLTSVIGLGALLLCLHTSQQTTFKKIGPTTGGRYGIQTDVGRLPTPLANCALSSDVTLAVLEDIHPCLRTAPGGFPSQDCYGHFQFRVALVALITAVSR